MPLSRKVLEQLQAEAMADDVLIDYATMAHWTESQAVQYFECGGAVEPAVENPSTALSWVHTREPELAVIERSLVAATASADARETPTASDSAADAVLQLPELAQRILDFVAEGGINRREVDASRHAEAEQESVANALRSSEATCRLWRSLNPQSRLWGSVPPVVLKVLREMHVKWPSRLQGFALPKILAGHDVLIVGDSGTGKTTCCRLTGRLTGLKVSLMTGRSTVGWLIRWLMNPNPFKLYTTLAQIANQRRPKARGRSTPEVRCSTTNYAAERERVGGVHRRVILPLQVCSPSPLMPPLLQLRSGT